MVQINPENGNPNVPKQTLFQKLDKNNDGKISDKELYISGYKDRENAIISNAIFNTERDVNKWFTLDKNKNGSADNVEIALWYLHNNNPEGIHEDMTPEEYAQKLNIAFDGQSYEDMRAWCESWITDTNPMCGTKVIAEKKLGRKLSDDEVQLLYDAMKMQMNRWLFKNDALYNNLTNTSYTRLATTEQTVSCCGGNIDKPPIGPQNPDEGCAQIFPAIEREGDINHSSDVKNRLAWAMFRTISQEQVQMMSPQAYKHYQEQWQTVRNMKAADFRALMTENKSAERANFEENSLMSVRQIVEYIDIVESVTGKDYDSDDWSIDAKQMFEIVEKINGNDGEENLLTGKTRADVPPERQELLRYLESQGLLLDQFKD